MRRKSEGTIKEITGNWKEFPRDCYRGIVTEGTIGTITFNFVTHVTTRGYSETLDGLEVFFSRWTSASGRFFVQCVLLKIGFRYPSLSIKLS